MCCFSSYSIKLMCQLVIALLVIVAIQAKTFEVGQLPIELVVVIPSYNNARYYKSNLDSIIKQTYSHFEIIYIDDCSTDQTGQLVEAYIKQNHLHDKIRVIHNKKRLGAMENWYNTIHSCADHKVIVSCDGDDHFYSITALEKIANAYADKTTWITYGQYQNYPDNNIGICRPFPHYIIQHNLFRQYPFVSSHVRTFYAGLFKRINVKDLKYKNKFVPVACDLALMMPMLEMASKNHITFIADVLYIHNEANPINDYKVRLNQFHKVEPVIRTIKPYMPLENLILFG